MTRDDYREQCFDAMEAAFLSGFYVKVVSPTIRNHVRQNIVAAFDALPTASVRVNPIEPTDEMLFALSGDETSHQICRKIFEAMSATGDLTNLQEKKP